MSSNSSAQFGASLVENLKAGLLFDRSDELAITTETLAYRSDRTTMGDVDMKIVSSTGTTLLSSLVPAATSIWRPRRPDDVNIGNSWWEIKRSCQVLKNHVGTFIK